MLCQTANAENAAKKLNSWTRQKDASKSALAATKAQIHAPASLKR